MGKFTLEIQTDNAAFEDYGQELALVLRYLAHKAESGDHYIGMRCRGAEIGKVFDSNGNSIGFWASTP